MIENLTNNTNSKVFTFLLLTFPIFRIYSSPIPGINYAELIILLFTLFLLLTKSSNLRLDFSTLEMKLLYIFLLFFFMTLISNYYIHYFSIYDSIARLLRWGFYVFLLVIARYFLDKQYAVKLIRRLVILSSVILWIQIFYYKIMGKVLTFKIPGFEIAATAYDTKRLELYYEKNIFRPYSLFLEPAHFSYFAIIGLCVVLFINDNGNSIKEYLLAIFITASLIASTSSSALFLTVAVWLYYFYRYIKYKHTHLKLLFGIVVLFIIFGIAMVLMQMETVQFAINKVFSGDEIGGSRMNSYKFYLGSLSGTEKVFGIGVGNEKKFFKESHGIEFGYSNTIGYLMVGTGILGLTLFSAYLILLWIQTHKDLRAFVMVFILTNIYSPMLFSINAIFILLWPCFFSQERRMVGIENRNSDKLKGLSG